MASKVSFKIDGLRAIGEELKKRGDNMARRDAAAAVGVGANVIRQDAQRRAPQSDAPHQLGVRKKEIAQPGNLKRNIVLKRVTDGRLTAEYVVGVRAGSGRSPDDAFYGDFIELGTVKMPAQPFIRPAFDSQKEAAVAKIVVVLKDRIENPR